MVWMSLELDISRTQHFDNIRKSDMILWRLLRLPDTFPYIFIDLHDNFPKISDFVAIFNTFVLRAQLELSNKLGYYEYVLLAKRSFPPYLLV